jgi:hypothetical protein
VPPGWGLGARGAALADSAALADAAANDGVAATDSAASGLTPSRATTGASGNETRGPTWVRTRNSPVMSRGL